MLLQGPLRLRRLGPLRPRRRRRRQNLRISPVGEMRQYPHEDSLDGFKQLAVVVLVAGTIFMLSPAAAESVCVKYGPCPLDITKFTCVDTPRSSFIRRVCYDAPRYFLVMKLKETWYPYCAVDGATVQKLLTADSMGRFYNKCIRSRRDGSRGPFDCRDHTMPNYSAGRDPAYDVEPVDAECREH